MKLIVLCMLLPAVFGQTGALSLSSGTAPLGGTVNLNLVYTAPPVNAAAALQWTLAYPASDITSVGVAAGPVLGASGKTEFACSQLAGSSTCVAAGLNTNPIGSGVVAVVTVTLASSTGSASVPISLGGVVGALANGTAGSIAGTGANIAVQNWQTVNQSPAVDSVTPGAGSGSRQSFVLAYSDPNGYVDLPWVQVNINGALNPVNACYAHYDRVANAVWLLNDATTGWIGPAVFGTAAKVQNSQCMIDAAASMAAGSGNNLAVSLAVTFKPAFAGAKSIYLQTADSAAAGSGWKQMGTWTVTASANQPPAVRSVSPNSGSGYTQTFALVYSDPNGFADLPWVQMNINSTLQPVNACYVHYDRVGNGIWVLNDAATGWIGPAAPGSSSDVQNSQCLVAGAASSAAGTGTTLTLNLAVTFKRAFTGARKIHLQTEDTGGFGTDWQQMGTWAVTASGNEAPEVRSVAPQAGSGSARTFTLLYSDPNGYMDLPWVQVNINSSLNPVNACYLHYDRAANAVWVLNDAGTAWTGPVMLGTAGDVQNSQCVVSAAGSSTAGAGNNLSVSLALTFKTAFRGPRVIYMQTEDSTGFGTGWQQMGTWTVP